MRGNDGEYDSVDEEDSNAEDNPLNEYPDEEEEGLLDDEEKEGIYQINSNISIQNIEKKCNIIIIEERSISL